MTINFSSLMKFMNWSDDYAIPFIDIDRIDKTTNNILHDRSYHCIPLILEKEGM